ncbi:PLP-dependent aminotransferase family protein [Vibrio sp. 03-59-1]|uniref:aminotransferase-like domain-containing protein n=1 Tax=Vibrio sp. 03-59-1 TaxID=2607607 RepID=UPI0014938CB4|nr:PLP-dependent aminotransferase family protein [Vibrio sp. 03-59-1]NOH82780.1 PLP-dependent aminotransferase family protein [Vibrio sp. 03-59-1]
MTRYEQLAQDIKRQISQKVWRSGEKIPSVRVSCKSTGYSIATVLQAYQLLESQGWVTAKPQSGYFVAPQIENLLSPQASSSPTKPKQININDQLFDVLQRNKQQDMVPLGSAFPDPSLFPQQALARNLASASRKMPENSAIINMPPGSESLRRNIAQRYAQQGLSVSPDDIVITSGAMEALSLSLQAVTKPGDLVVIESPTFYGALQTIERLNLRAVEIPTHPLEGIDLIALEKALTELPIKACWLMTNFQNPLGFCMSDHAKQSLVDLLHHHQTPLIEDDVYAELFFSPDKPKPAKAFDQHDDVLLCGSFSKCLSPGFRIGWVVAGQRSETIQRFQLMSTLSSSVPIQLGISHYLQFGSFDAHLRKLRRKLEQHKHQMLAAIRTYFPDSISVTDPSGGYFIWIEFGGHFDCSHFYEQALQSQIAVAPGTLFSSDNQGSKHIRINYSYPCEGRILNAIIELGRLAHLTLNKPE